MRIFTSSYPSELKARIIGAHESGATPGRILKMYNVPISTILRIIEKWNRDGTVFPRKSPGRRPILTPLEINTLINDAKKDNRRTIQEIAKSAPKPVSKKTVQRILHAHGV
ncbi:hypothetical protein BGZ46_001070 [Entomortierella lignicola]|nr:hypothetical protein BGZ46_001070 [Entomortierella lignicola]